ncbi:hypothetical protein RB195_023788 [Necator americanus]|uniref:Reverse transcriptase domain-containing protein n=1 Tax=Necator americanus TaxID=51031 RepID=A0ABR1EKK2_NECAM
MQLVFPDLKADFDSLHRSHLLKTLRADRVAGKFVCIPDGMNQRTTAAVRTDAVGERGIKVDEQPIELVNEYYYLGCMLNNNAGARKLSVICSTTMYGAETWAAPSTAMEI